MENKISKSITFLSIFIFSVASVFLGKVSLCVWLLVFFVLLFLGKGFLSRRFSIILMLTFALGIFYTTYRIPTHDGLQKYFLAPCEVSGIVTSAPKYTNQRAKFYLDVTQVNQPPKNAQELGKTVAYVTVKEPIEAGDKIVLKGKFQPPKNATNFGQFDYANYLRNQGIFTVFYAQNYKISGQSSDLFFKSQRFFSDLTEKVIKKHAKPLNQMQLDLLGGVIFGHRAVEMDENIQQDFINSGVYHILAASGMQVGLVLVFWLFVMKFLKVPYNFSLLTGGLVIVLYAGATGFPASILRALFMAEFIILGKLIDRQADNAALLLLVCSLMLFYNPLYVLDVGFQLSFITTFGLLFSMPKLLEKMPHVPEIISGTILLTLIAQTFASPLLIYYFNNLPLYSLFSNILIVPVVTIITFIGFGSSLVALLPHTEFLTTLAAKILAPFLFGMDYIASFFSHLPHSLIYTGQIGVLSVIISYIFIMFFILAFNNDFKNKALNTISIVSLSIFLLLNIPTQKNLEIVFFNVGESDAILVKLPNKKQFLVDTGRNNPYGTSAGKTIITEYLKATGKNNLEAIILTHPDSDHIGGCADVLNFAGKCPVYKNSCVYDSSTYTNLEKYLAQNKIPTRTMPRNSTQELNFDPSVKIKLFAPGGKDNNSGSLVTYIEDGDFRALLMGDNEKFSTDFLGSKIKKPITVLKLGHHGSKDSIDEKMIQALSPQNVVISVGKNNFNHPDFETLELLDKHHLKTYRTDLDNMILVKHNGQNLTVKKYYPELKRIE